MPSVYRLRRGGDAPVRARPGAAALFAALAAIALPERCVACGRFGASLHETCVRTLAPADGPRCPLCWQPGESTRCERCGPGPGPSSALGVDGLRAGFRFEGTARRALIEAKFRGISTLLPPLARAAADAVPDFWAPDAVVPVPLSAARRRRRGFNQAQVAAEAVARALGCPLEVALVQRVRDTTPQSTLTAAERERNLDAAFVAHGAPARVLVVDDVTTTGTTLAAVAHALRAAGARQVLALALARED